MSNPYTLQNIQLDHTITSELIKPEPFSVFWVEETQTLKDITGSTWGATVTGSVNTSTLVNSSTSKDYYILKLTMDPNRLSFAKQHLEGVSVSIQGDTYFKIGKTEDSLVEIIPAYTVDTASEENDVVTKYIKVLPNQTLHLEEATPAMGGWITKDGSYQSGGMGSIYEDPGYDSNPPEEGAILYKYIVCVYSTYDPLLDESSITIDYDFTK